MVLILLEKCKNDTWFIENRLFRAIKNNQQNIVNLFIHSSLIYYCIHEKINQGDECKQWDEIFSDIKTFSIFATEL